MPRLTESLFATLLLIASVASETAHAQATAVPAAETASNDFIAADSPLAAQLPIRLVKRTQQPPTSTARSRYGDPIELPPPKRTSRGSDRQGRERQSATTGNVASVVLSSLAIVLGLFFLVVWLARRALPKSTTSLPSDVLEILGRSPLATRHNLQLIRLGRRLLLVSVTPDTAETLTEITDPDEVNHLVSLCQQQRPESITGSFRQVLNQLSSQEPRPRNASRRRRGTSALDTDISSDMSGNSAADALASLRQGREIS